MKTILITMLYLCLYGTLHAQIMDKEVITSNGGSYTINNIHFDWTLGEFMTETYEHSLTLEQGFLHQSNENSITTSNKEDNRIHKNSLIFPNPASHSFRVQSVKKYDKVALLMPNGSPLQEWSKSSDNSIIQIQDIPSGVYLVVLKNQNEIIDQSPIIITH